MPLIEAQQFPFRHFHQGFHHGVMPLAVLQGETVFSIDFILFKKPVIGQFFAAQTNQHDFSTKVRVTDKVPHGTNGNDGKGGVDGNPTAIRMVHGNNVVNVRVFGQKFLFNLLNGYVDHTGSALDSRHNTEDIARTGRPDGIFITHPCRAWRRGEFLHRHNMGPIFHMFYGRTLGQIQHMFIDPAAAGNVILGITEDNPVADNFTPFGYIHKGHLMGLWNGVTGNNTGHDFNARFQVMDGNGNIIAVLDTNDKRSCHK